MAKIASFFLSENIQSMNAGNGNDVSILISPQVVLRPQYIPGLYSFGIALGIIEQKIEDNLRVRLTISDPDGELVFNPEEETLQAPKIVDDLDEKYQGFTMCTDIRNMEIKQSGEYTLELYINGEIIGKETIPIIKKEQK